MKNDIRFTILLQKVREARQPFRDVAPGEEVQKPFVHINTCFAETFGDDTSQLLLLGKFEYGGGPIFKVVLEC